MISAALRRFGALFLASATGVALLSLLGGVALGSGVNRSLSVGFYVSGSAILIFGFFAGIALVFLLRDRTRRTTAPYGRSSAHGDSCCICLGAIPTSGRRRRSENESVFPQQ